MSSATMDITNSPMLNGSETDGASGSKGELLPMRPLGRAGLQVYVVPSSQTIAQMERRTLTLKTAPRQEPESFTETSRSSRRIALGVRGARRKITITLSTAKDGELAFLKRAQRGKDWRLGNNA
eukprot:jgi/Botrbrau1/23203/Bobra.0041s0047.1